MHSLWQLIINFHILTIKIIWIISEQISFTYLHFGRFKWI